LQGVRVRVGHARDAKESPADGFVRTIEVDGELSVEQRARLIEMAERCPVHRTLERGARVETVVAAQATVPPDVESAGQHALDMDAGVGGQ
jgi:putative redox protein